MIICSCRNIKSSSFTSTEDLKQRILQCDHRCGKCQEAYLNKCFSDGPVLEFDRVLSNEADNTGMQNPLGLGDPSRRS